MRDLIECFKRCAGTGRPAVGQVYNIGGGPRNSLSLIELLRHLEARLGQAPKIRWADERAGDQKVFICDVRSAATDLEWQPRIGLERGLDELLEWLQENLDLIERTLVGATARLPSTR